MERVLQLSPPCASYRYYRDISEIEIFRGSILDCALSASHVFETDGFTDATRLRLASLSCSVESITGHRVDELPDRMVPDLVDNTLADDSILVLRLVDV